MRRKIDEIIERWDDSKVRKALLITGSRQVGKTYSIREFGRRRYPGRFLEINFKDSPDACSLFDGDLSVDRLITRLSIRYPEFEFEPGNTLIFLDEVQDCPNARTALKPLADDGRYRVIASGSLMGIYMKDVGLHPMGYLVRRHMFPMDFEEFLWALNLPQAAIDDVKGSISRTEPIDNYLFRSFSELHSMYMAVGGMPAAVASFAVNRTFSGLRDIFYDLLEGYAEDMASYASRSTKKLASSCLRSIPRMLAAENKKFMYSRVEMDEGIREGSKSTGFRYFAPALEWLEMANITLTCNCVSEPVSPLEERLQTDRFKLYMLDTGVLVHMYGSQVLTSIGEGRTDVNMGAVAENAVAQAFHSQGRSLMYLSKDDPRAEVDFITMIDGRVCCVEVKSGKERSCRSLNRIMDMYGTDGLMFETRNVFVDEKGVRHYPLFASSFMDSMDPEKMIECDLSMIDSLVRRYGDTRV